MQLSGCESSDADSEQPDAGAYFQQTCASDEDCGPLRCLGDSCNRECEALSDCQTLDATSVCVTRNERATCEVCPEYPYDDSYARFGLPLADNAPVVDIAVGNAHVCVLLAGGSVRCWGENDQGQLGYGHTERIGDDEVPADAGDVPLGATAVQIVAGYNATCAVLSTGGFKCWGFRTGGQIGKDEYGDDEYENIGDDETPADVNAIELPGQIRRMVVGYSSYYAVMTDGTVIYWSVTDLVGTGNAALAEHHVDLQDAAPLNINARVLDVDSGIHHSCALFEDGSVRCWGRASGTLLGDGTGNPADEYISAADAVEVDIGGKNVAIAVGRNNTCVVMSCGEVKCWGYGDKGSLGQGNSDDIGDDEVPAAVEPISLGGPAVAVSSCSELADQFNCALLWSGEVRCWGWGSGGVLGYASRELLGNDELPSDVDPIRVGGPVFRIGSGDKFSCALLQSGDVRCWGHGGNGAVLGQPGHEQIGSSDHPDSVDPIHII